MQTRDIVESLAARVHERQGPQLPTDARDLAEDAGLLIWKRKCSPAMRRILTRQAIVAYDPLVSFRKRQARLARDVARAVLLDGNLPDTDLELVQRLAEALMVPRGPLQAALSRGYPYGMLREACCTVPARWIGRRICAVGTAATSVFDEDLVVEERHVSDLLGELPVTDAEHAMARAAFERRATQQLTARSFAVYLPGKRRSTPAFLRQGSEPPECHTKRPSGLYSRGPRVMVVCDASDLSPRY